MRFKITEIGKNTTAVSVLYAIKLLQEENQEDPRTSELALPIGESEISQKAGANVGVVRYWVGKLTEVDFLEEGFGEVYGMSQSGLGFLFNKGLLT